MVELVCQVDPKTVVRAHVGWRHRRFDGARVDGDRYLECSADGENVALVMHVLLTIQLLSALSAVPWA